MSNKFKINKIYKCVYVKNIDKSCVIVCHYIDDLLNLSSNKYMIKSTRKILTNKFYMKDLSVVDVILKIKIARIYNESVLFQSYHVKKNLKKKKN